MNRRLVRIVLPFLALAAALALRLAGVSFTEEESPHEFRDCFGCHFTVPREGGPVERPLRMIDTISNICARCHDMTKMISHQVDMIPSGEIEIPADMPLDEKGNMTCATCHDVHKAYSNPLTGGRSYFLRRDEQGKNFCLACHSTEEAVADIKLADITPFGVRVPIESHMQFMDRGHGFAKFTVLDPGEDLDPLSLACLDCHDGGTPKTSLGSGIYQHASEGIGLSHPIGMDYEDAARRDPELTPPEELDPRVMLFEGKLGCCTCHNPYAPMDDNSLVIGGHGSFQDLCLACHKK